MKNYAQFSTFLYTWAQSRSNQIVAFSGLILVLSGLTETVQAQAELDWDQERIATAADFLLQMIEGAFGALIMVVAGIAAIVAATMGAYRASIAMLVVAIGSFILRSLVELFFGPDFLGTDDF